MKIGMKRIGMSMLIVIILFSAVIAFALPGMPHKFFGDVMIDGLPAPDGLWVEAVIDGVFYEWGLTSGGQYGWDIADLFNVPADDPDTSEKEGGVSGDWVEFYVDGFYADTAYFENGASTWFDLHVTTTVYELQLYAGWNLIGLPFIPDDPSIEVVLGDILYHVESVWTYDAWSGYWSSYSPYAPSDLTMMVDGKGYWIKVWEDVLWEMGTG